MARGDFKLKIVKVPAWLSLIFLHAVLWVMVCVIEAVLPDRAPNNGPEFFDFGSSHKGYFISQLENLDFLGIQLWFKCARELILIEPSIRLLLPVNMFMIALVFGTCQWAVIGEYMTCQVGMDG
jgi:hypothetical protein